MEKLKKLKLGMLHTNKSPRDIYSLQKQVWRTVRNQQKEIQDYITTQKTK